MTVDVYFRMLTFELAGEAYAKAEHRREVERDVERSSVAIEYKFNNVSAVLDEIGVIWIPGYKPLRNVQERLRVRVRERFEADHELRSFMLTAVADPAVEPSTLGNEISPPDVDWPERSRAGTGALDIDFAALESANRALGRAGELAVLEAERRRLAAGGRPDLAADVRHVSDVDGDGLGYDIQSFRALTDEPTYVEVKTTRFGKEVPFYISGNEVETSARLGASYALLRLYRYGKQDAGHYRLRGPIAQSAALRPDSYRGLPAKQVDGTALPAS